MTNTISLKFRTVRRIAGLPVCCVIAILPWTNAWAQMVDVEPDHNCRLKVEAKLPLTQIHGHYLAPVDIAGKSYPIEVDTGADKTALTPQAADTLQLGQDMSAAERVGGVGGSVDPQYSRIISALKFGSSEWDNLVVPTSNMLTATQLAMSPTPIGLLGANVLSRYDVEFDFPASTMTLYSAEGCLGRFAPWVGNYYSYSPEYTQRHRFILSLVLNGHRVRAVIDTGASRSLLTRAAAVAVGVDGATLDRDPTSSGTGMKGTPIDIRLHRFDSLRIGPITYRNVVIDVGDTPLADADMLLGMDFMKSRRVWFSYSTGWVFMQPASGPLAAQVAPPQFGKTTFLPARVARQIDALPPDDELDQGSPTR
ncbi:putative aspartyl protease [Paraburkholderia sp. GAS33]|uniref:aspartyl protease family protein n=1 Tax=Paraburkholderia sp. GAS33 TaxID=3035130 RepID=UPI003D214F15